jgi:phospholipase C
MGFYNVQQDDLPFFKTLADTYSMSDNYHQAVNGGTGANRIMLGTGYAIWFSDGNGNPLQLPHNMPVAVGNPNAGVVDEIENPNPLQTPPTNNWYIQDGYGGGSFGEASYGEGSYTACADTSQPGVAAIVSYLTSLNVKPNCDSGHYYLLNNYNPGYFGTRIPMIVVSNFSTGGHISHIYTDHVSVSKFIEANWNVPPITSRSRDNLPNPITGADPYSPTNGPAIGAVSAARPASFFWSSGNDAFRA